MRQLFFTTTLVFTFFVLQLSAQVNFSSRPSSLQVYPRESNDSSVVTISGDITTTGFTKVIFTMHKNGVINDSSIVNLSYNGGIAPFSKNYSIHAEKSHYRFKMFLFNGTTSTQILRSDSVCSGDIYLINGQSNATAVANGSGTDAQYIWVRSFGTENDVDVTCQADTVWGTGNGNSGNNHLSIGVWAIRLGKMLADSSGVPVCFINGSRSGTRIIEHLPSPNHADLTSYYGRLLYRAQKARVTNKIKALFWYQGESDTDTAHLQYANRFAQLYTAWKQDYSGLSKIILIQIRPGCLITQNTIYHQQERELQRTLANTYPDITLMATVGIPNFDGCHLFTSGYQQLALQLYNQLCDDFISKPVVANSDPPKLLTAIYTNNSNTELSLVFDQVVLWPDLFNGYNLKDYIYLNSNTTILSGATGTNDTIKLQLSASTNSSNISYLPPYYYAGTNIEYLGPWLLNTKNVGVPSFYQFTITNNLVISANRSLNLCGGDSIILSTIRTGQTYQWYLNGGVISGATNQTYIAKVPGTYTLIAKDANNLTVTSNVIVITSIPAVKPVITSANGKSVVCSGSSLTLNSTSATNWLWNTGESTSSINVNAAGGYAVRTTSAYGCTSLSDTFYVTLEVPVKPVISSANGNSVFCQGGSLTLNSTAANSWLWNTGATTASIVVSLQGSYLVSTTSSNGCTSVSDTFHTTIDIPVKPVISSANGKSVFCQGSNLTLNNSAVNNWIWNTGATTSSIVVSNVGGYTVGTTSVNGCTSVSDTFNVTTEVPVKPVISSANGKSVFCQGSSLTLNSTAAYSWLWNTGATTSTIVVNSVGSYTVGTTSVNGCTSVSDTFNVTIEVPVKPTISSANGKSVFCQGGSITLNSTAANSWLWNTGAVTVSVIVSTPGGYTVTTSSINGCTSVSDSFYITIDVPVKPVINSLNGKHVFCQESNLTLISSVTDSLLWNTGGTTSSIVVNTPGNYTVSTTTINGCTRASDTFSCILDIPVKPLIVSDKPNLCLGDSVRLSVSNYPSANWSNGSSGSNIYIQDSSTYSATITDSIGCLSESDTVLFPIRSLPDAFINASSLYSCPGHSVLLSSGNSANSYLWSTGAVTSSISVTTPDEYGLSVIDEFGCTNTAPPVQILFVTPVVSVNPSGTRTICTGTKQILTAVYNSTPGTFKWYRNNALIAGATNSSYQAGTAGTYKVVYTDINGCSATSLGTVIAISGVPASTFTISNQYDVCGDTVVTCTATNTAAGLTYQWQKNTVDIPGANNQIYITSAKASYRVITTNIYGCSKNSSAIAIPAINPVNPTITAASATTFCIGDSVKLTSSGGAGYLYQWYRGTPAIAGATAQSYTAKITGNYKVRITIPMGCTANSGAVAVKANTCGARMMSDGNVTMADELSVYPQPFSNDFILRIPAELITGNYYFEMYNTEGALVMHSKQIVFNNGESIIRAGMLPRGVYFYKMVNDEKVYNGRVIKE